MGLFKSLKEKASRMDGSEQQSSVRSESSSADRKYLYQEQAQSPEIIYDNQKARHSYSRAHAPPSGLSPSVQPTEANPPPYESWLSVPDTSQLPPPPNISNEFSPSGNASYYSAKSGHRWCAKHPIYTPSIPQKLDISTISKSGELGLDPPPPGFKGSIQQVNGRTWNIKTDYKQQDMILTSALPAYFAAMSNPLLQTTSATANPGTVTFSFSVSINTLHNDAVIAVGFTCKPYPPFRLPGWHRGSLAVHSDDGRRYINDPHGGIDFIAPLPKSDEVRISMSVIPQPSPVQEYRGQIAGIRRVGTLPKCTAQVQVERNGRVEGQWQIHEEKDGERDEGIEGLQGEADLYCAVGVFGKTGFTIRFEES